MSRAVGVTSEVGLTTDRDQETRRPLFLRDTGKSRGTNHYTTAVVKRPELLVFQVRAQLVNDGNSAKMLHAVLNE